MRKWMCSLLLVCLAFVVALKGQSWINDVSMDSWEGFAALAPGGLDCIASSTSDDQDAWMVTVTHRLWLISPTGRTLRIMTNVGTGPVHSTTLGMSADEYTRSGTYYCNVDYFGEIAGEPLFSDGRSAQAVLSNPGCDCAPVLKLGHQTYGTRTVSVEGEFGDGARDAVYRATGYWTEIADGVGAGVRTEYLVGGTGDIRVLTDSSVPQDRAWSFCSTDGRGTVKIHPDHTRNVGTFDSAQISFLHELFAHELGHCVGFADVQPPCSTAHTIMFYQNSGSFQGIKTPDRCAIRSEWVAFQP